MKHITYDSVKEITGQSIKDLSVALLLIREDKSFKKLLKMLKYRCCQKLLETYI